MTDSGQPGVVVAERQRTCGLVSPLAVDSAPQFSWTFAGSGGAQPAGARVELYGAGAEPIWSAQWIAGGIPTLSYDGPRLEPSAAYRWAVTVTSTDGVESRSEDAVFETGIGTRLPELAEWIGLTVTEDEYQATRVQYLRREFALAARVTRARLHIASLGWNAPWLNGTALAGNRISPRFTAFDHRVEYESYDVTAQLRRGDNRLGIQLAEGRYRGKVGGGGLRGAYGNQLRVIAVLEITTADGKRTAIATGAGWEGGYGPVVLADPQDGACIDSRIPGARFTELADADWAPVAEALTFETDVAVVAARSEAVREVECRWPLSTSVVQERIVVDFGQNLSGVTRIDVLGEPGQEITIGHSELRRGNGLIDRDYLAMGGLVPAQPVDRFILDGTRQEFVPPFTMRGFQFAEIEGLRPDQLLEVSALVIAADLDYHGHFESSHAGLNKLHENIVWSMRGNFTDLPTDCPTRERSGWTGDAQVFAPAAAFLGDVHNYYADWLRDVALQQDPDGAVRDIVPREVEKGDHSMANLVPLRGSAGWGDAITLIPWYLFEHYGRKDVAAERWDAMVAWVEFCRRRAAGNRQADRTGEPRPHERFIVDTGFHWGEHLAADDIVEIETPEQMIAGLRARSTHPDAEVATAYFARSTYALARLASVLGKVEAAKEYTVLWENIRSAYQAEFLGADGLPSDHRQAPWVRPLAFDLLPEEARQPAADRLAEIVAGRGNHVGTGFLSTGFLLGVLSRNGHAETALDVLLQHEAPSWLAEVDEGATTIWESYAGVGSRNHYSLGAIARWFYEDLAGLRRIGPGWSTTIVSPLLNDRVDRVSATTLTPFGRLSCQCRLERGVWRIDVEIPAGMSARLSLPGEKLTDLPSGGSSWTVAGRVPGAAASRRPAKRPI